MHLPGHTAGSIALIDKSNGILATGDTLYKTDEQLIDWYVGGSSVAQMARSVEKLVDQLPNIDVVLPGHNEVIEATEAKIHGENYLKMAKGSGRKIKKVFSRFRTSMLIGIHSRGHRVTGFAREWMKN